MTDLIKEYIEAKLPFEISLSMKDVGSLKQVKLYDVLKNECMLFYIDLNKKLITIKSIRYTASEKNCLLRGSDLLKYVVNLCGTLVDEIQLSDESKKKK